MRKKKWKIEELKQAVIKSYSLRQAITQIGLIPAGGNYRQIRQYIESHHIDTSHFTGQGWSKDKKKPFLPRRPLKSILVQNSDYQTFKLKNRLYLEGLKKPRCEECGWAMRSPDGRIPLELDHINGDSRDNRIHNLRILCPNCHSLKPTHRGRNRRK